MDRADERHSEPTSNPTADEIRSVILRLAGERGPSKTICPSEAARAIGGSNEKVWRRHMTPIKREAIALANEGWIELRRKGRRIEPADLRGIYRIAILLPCDGG